MGAGPTPIETAEGWLVLYHGVTTSCNGFVYSMGAALLDLPSNLSRGRGRGCDSGGDAVGGEAVARGAHTVMCQLDLDECFSVGPRGLDQAGNLGTLFVDGIGEVAVPLYVCFSRGDVTGRITWQCGPSHLSLAQPRGEQLCLGPCEVGDPLDEIGAEDAPEQRGSVGA